VTAIARRALEVAARLAAAERERDELLRAGAEAEERMIALAATVDDLRAVLAPLLADPWRIVVRAGGTRNACAFCRGRYAPDRPDRGHRPDCPVRRADRLLGRAPATESACPVCGGAGRVGDDVPCTRCGGSGASP
jgi:hypothetical protein